MNNPLVSLDELSKPLTKLVEVIAKGVGTLYAPFGTVRQARADAASNIILARADVQVTEIQERARSRIEYREALRQENIERISVLAARELPGEVSTADVQSDWVLQFFDAAQDICDEDMQLLWARVLSGEVSQPETFSKRTLQFLKTLDKSDAELFSQLCSVSLSYETGWHLVIAEPPTLAAMRKKIADSGDFIRHLVSIGLLLSDDHLCTPSECTGMKLQYFDRRYTLEGPTKAQIGGLGRLEAPMFFKGFTVMGQELSTIAGPVPIDGYIEELTQYIDETYKVKFIGE